MNIWNEVKHLFVKDDDSLPDIFIRNITHDECIGIYEWLMSQCVAVQQTMVWSVEKECDVFLHEVPFPARALCEGRIETFHHALDGLAINEILLPGLCIFVCPNEITLDYRVGEEWNERNVNDLFVLLNGIQQIAPLAQINQADENGYKNTVFNHAFKVFCTNV